MRYVSMIMQYVSMSMQDVSMSMQDVSKCTFIFLHLRGTNLSCGQNMLNYTTVS